MRDVNPRYQDTTALLQGHCSNGLVESVYIQTSNAESPIGDHIELTHSHDGLQIIIQWHLVDFGSLGKKMLS